MAFINPLIYLANRSGIPRIQSTSVSVNGTTNVVYNFSSTSLFSNNYSGLVLVKLSQTIPSGTTTTLPIVFTSDAGTTAITQYGGEAITVDTFAGTGIYLMYYDRATNTLQTLTGIASA